MVIKLIFRKDVQALEFHILQAIISQSQPYKKRLDRLQLQTKVINQFLMVVFILKQTSSHLNRDKRLNFFLQVKTNFHLRSSIPKAVQSHSLKQKAFTTNRYVGKQDLTIWMSIMALKEVNMKLIQDLLGSLYNQYQRQKGFNRLGGVIPTNLNMYPQTTFNHRTTVRRRIV